MRQNLQVRLTQLQLKHEKDRLTLIRDLSHMARAKGKSTPDFSKLKEHSPNRSPTHNSKSQKGNNHGKPNIDIEPEI